MELERALEIVSALAEGINPLTGELLPFESVYNQGDVVRALYAVVDACAPREKGKKKEAKEPISYDKALYEKLRIMRNELANQKKMLPFQIVTNATLMYMADQKPVDREQLLKIRGIGKYTADQYGAKFIDEIKDYLNK